MQKRTPSAGAELRTPYRNLLLPGPQRGLSRERLVKP
jgi:hypothetical protein